MTENPTFRMVRAEDQLILDVACQGMRISPAPGPGGVHSLELTNGAAAGRVTLTFPTQQTLEYAQNANGVRLFQAKPIFAPPTVVVLSVPPFTAPVPATVAGVLGLARQLALVTSTRSGSVTAVAAPRETERPRRRALSERLTVTHHPQAAPGATDTFPNTGFAFPYRLLVRPPGGATRLHHQTQAVKTDGSFPLWTAALGVLAGGRTFEADLPVIFGTTPQSGSPTKEWQHIVNDDKLNNPLRGGDAEKLQRQTDPPAVGSAPRPPIQPAISRRLRLSTLGGWLDVDGRWPGQDIVRWEHSTAMGRDQSQLVVRQGILYPFGFRATATSQAVRVIERGSTRAAALHTKASVVVDDPFFPFGTFEEQPGWPYRQIRCLTTGVGPGVLKTVTAAGVPAVPGVERLTIRGRNVEFDLVALDRMGQEVHFQLPLLFVPNSQVNNANLPALWRAQGGRFTEIELGGQPHGMAPETAEDEAADVAPLDARQAARQVARHATRKSTPSAGRAADGDGPVPAQVTTVLARALAFDVDSAGKVLTKRVTGLVPSLDKLLPGRELVLSYAPAYLSAQFGAANVGKVFLQLAAEQVTPVVVALGKQAVDAAAGEVARTTGGLAAMELPIAALSRKYGAVAGIAEDVAAGNLNMETVIAAGDTLLGVIPLRKMFESAIDQPLPKLPIGKPDGVDYRLVTDVREGVATLDLTFATPLFGKPDELRSVDVGSFARLLPLRPVLANGEPDPAAKNEAKLTIKQHTESDTADPLGAVRARNETRVDMVELHVRFQDKTVVAVPFVHAAFISVDGKTPDPDIEIGKIRFGGILELLAKLAELIDTKGFNDPPALEVSDQGVRSSFSLALPSLAIGVFALENISFGAAIALSFTGQPLTLDVNFGTPDNPFRATVAMFGGGGSLAVGLSTRGLETVNGVLEFGASVSVDLFIARAAAEVMGGVAFHYRREPEQGALTAFLRIHGEVDILSLISICVDLMVALEYQFIGEDAGKLTGTASVAVEVKVIFFSETVTLKTSQKFAGSNGDPTFAELMAPEGVPADALPWHEYCAAFAA